MDNTLEKENYLVFIDGHIAELEQRISALRNRMGAMILEKYEVRNQELLLSVMLETRKDLAKFRADLMQPSLQATTAV